MDDYKFFIFLLAVCYQVTIGSMIDLLKLEASSLTNLSYLNLNKPNWFVTARYGDFPMINYNTTANLYEVICDFCDVAALATQSSEIFFNGLFLNDSIFVSAYSSNSEPDDNLEVSFFYNTSETDLGSCSGHGIISQNGACDCFIGYSGYRCEVNVNIINKKIKNQMIDQFDWKFYFVPIDLRNSARFTIKTKNHLYIYADLSNSTQNLPFMNHCLYTFEVTRRHSVLIENYKESIYERFLVLSVFCVDDIGCNFSIENEIHEQSDSKRVIKISIISSTSVVVLVALALIFVKLWKKHKENEKVARKNSIISKAAAKLEVKIPAKLFKDEISNALCTVCMNEIKIDEMVRMLQCTHIFHEPCIDEWAVHNGNCPVCKAIFVEDWDSLTHQN